MKRRAFLSTPLYLKSMQRPSSSQALFFNYMLDMQSNLRHEMLIDPTSKLLDMDHEPRADEPDDAANIPLLTQVWHEATERYLVPYLETHRPQLLERELEGQEFNLNTFNGYTRRYELYAQRMQLDFSLMAYACRYEGFFDGMPLTMPAMEDDVYNVQKWERVTLKKFDAELLRREREEGAAQDLSAEAQEERLERNRILVDELLHSVIKEHTKDVQKAPEETFRRDYINNLFKYVVVDSFHTDLFSKNHQAWRFKAFARLGKHTEPVQEEEEFGAEDVGKNDRF